MTMRAQHSFISKRGKELRINSRASLRRLVNRLQGISIEYDLQPL